MILPATPFIPGEYRIKHTERRWELDGCLALRRRVFCEEQAIFDGDDQDALDPTAITIAAITCVAAIPERVVGTVRINQHEHGLWSGSRLAVDASYRRCAWLGSELIRHAVSTAHARGCRHFLAQVQVQNVCLFERLHWHSLLRIEVQGRPHVLMQPDLAHYPPRTEPELRFITGLRSAA